MVDADADWRREVPFWVLVLLAGVLYFHGDWAATRIARGVDFWLGALF